MATFIEGPTANEIFDVFDESNSRVIGQERRGVVHAKGLWHRSVNILLLNSNGDMLVQKRMPTKDGKLVLLHFLFSFSLSLFLLFLFVLSMVWV